MFFVWSVFVPVQGVFAGNGELDSDRSTREGYTTLVACLETLLLCLFFLFFGGQCCFRIVHVSAYSDIYIYIYILTDILFGLQNDANSH